MGPLTRAVLALGCAALVGCGPSKAEREAAEKRLAEAEAKQKAEEAKAAKVIEDLKALAERVRGSCAQEFARASAEHLGPGEPGECALPKAPVFIAKHVSSRNDVADLGEAQKRLCEDLQKELDLAVKRAGPENPSRSAIDDAKALDELSRTVVVGLIHEKNESPSLLKDKLGNPTAFKAGSWEGAALLYSVGAGKLLCASKVAAKNSDKVATFKFEPGTPLGPEGTAFSDIYNDLDAQIEKALESAPRLALVTAPKKEPPPPPKKGKKAAAKKKKR